MQKLFRQRLSQKMGLAPGTLMHVGDEHRTPVQITYFDYNADSVKEGIVVDVEECRQYVAERDTVTWLNVDGVHDVGLIEKLGDIFDLHPLLQEDIAHTSQRPKLEEFDKRLFIVLRMVYTATEKDDGHEEFVIKGEQISLVLGPNFVLTFLEDPEDVFDPVRQRLRENRGRVRKAGADYLAYVLMDLVVDNYFTVLEQFGEEVEDLEAELLKDPRSDALSSIQGMKRAMIEMRRAAWPARDVINVLLRGDSKLFKKPTLVFLRDVYDHAVRVVDIVETYREMIGSMLDIYLSTVSNRMNEVMKVLTVIATIFIPLTFIAGVYGMNFDNMPELHWAEGYWYVWGIMLIVGALLLFYFKKKDWL
jgi:magnesium transporter